MHKTDENLPTEAYPDFEDDYETVTYKDGYAAISLVGADRLSYFTIIDKDGKQMFEPRNDFQSLSVSNDKYAVAKMSDHVLAVLNMDGNISLTASLYSGDKAGEFIQNVPNRAMHTVSCGMLRVPSADRYGNDVYIRLLAKLSYNSKLQIPQIKLNLRPKRFLRLRYLSEQF